MAGRADDGGASRRRPLALGAAARQSGLLAEVVAVDAGDDQQAGARDGAGHPRGVLGGDDVAVAAHHQRGCRDGVQLVVGSSGELQDALAEQTRGNRTTAGRPAVDRLRWVPLPRNAGWPPSDASESIKLA